METRRARLPLPSGRRNPDASRRWRSSARRTQNPERGCRQAPSARVLSELIDQIGGYPQVAGIAGPQQHARLDVAVKIGAARDHQAVTLCQPEILLRVAARMIAVIGLDGV